MTTLQPSPTGKGRTPYPLAPNQPQGQRSRQYRDPTYTPQEKALIEWVKKLPQADADAIWEQATKPKPPIGLDALMELIQEYKGVLAREGRSPRTVEIYASDTVSFYRFCAFEERDVTEMSPLLLLDYCKFLARYRYHRNTVSRKLTALKGFLRYLRSQGILDRAQLPPARLFVTKVPKPLPDNLSQMEVQRLIEAPDPVTWVGIRDRAILEVLYGAGLRVSEVVGLDVGDLELRYKTLLVRQGNGGKDRWAQYGQPAKQALVRYLQEARPELEKCTPQGNGYRRTLPAKPEVVGTGPLFLNRYGQRMSVRMVQKLIKGYAKLVGIHRNVYPHLLRHSFATHMLENGATTPAIKELLGHASITTTQVYTHVTNTEAKKALLEHHPRGGPGNDLLAAVLKRGES